MRLAEKTAIFQEKGVGRNTIPEFLDQFLLAVMIAADGHGNFDVRAQFHQTHFADLREGAVTTTAAASAEVCLISRRVRHVQTVPSMPMRRRP